MERPAVKAVELTLVRRIGGKWFAYVSMQRDEDKQYKDVLTNHPVKDPSAVEKDEDVWQKLDGLLSNSWTYWPCTKVRPGGIEVSLWRDPFTGSEGRDFTEVMLEELSLGWEAWQANEKAASKAGGDTTAWRQSEKGLPPGFPEK